MSETKVSQRLAMIYLLLTLAFSSVFYFLILRAQDRGAAGGLHTVGILWCPAFAGAVTRRIGFPCEPNGRDDDTRRFIRSRRTQTTRASTSGSLIEGYGGCGLCSEAPSGNWYGPRPG
jgi:hypothetical protein